MSRVFLQFWRFPEIGVPPVLIHFNGIFPNKNHPAIGVPPLTPTCFDIVCYTFPRWTHQRTSELDLGTIPGTSDRLDFQIADWPFQKHLPNGSKWGATLRVYVGWVDGICPLVGLRKKEVWRWWTSEFLSVKVCLVSGVSRSRASVSHGFPIGFSLPQKDGFRPWREALALYDLKKLELQELLQQCSSSKRRWSETGSSHENLEVYQATDEKKGLLSSWLGDVVVLWIGRSNAKYPGSVLSPGTEANWLGLFDHWFSRLFWTSRRVSCPSKQGLREVRRLAQSLQAPCSQHGQISMVDTPTSGHSDHNHWLLVWLSVSILLLLLLLVTLTSTSTISITIIIIIIIIIIFLTFHKTASHQYQPLIPIPQGIPVAVPYAARLVITAAVGGRAKRCSCALAAGEAMRQVYPAARGSEHAGHGGTKWGHLRWGFP